MKKQYISPTAEPLKMQPASLIATSIPVKGESDTEARSREFWGNSIFEDSAPSEDDETDSWF